MTLVEFAPLAALASGVYLAGCLAGHALRGVITRDEPTTSRSPAPPARLPAPRDGRRDNLKHIKGIGPAIERELNALGIYHFDQVAAWDRRTTAWVEDRFGFPGRISREKWISKARELAASSSPRSAAPPPGTTPSRRVPEPLRP